MNFDFDKLFEDYLKSKTNDTLKIKPQICLKCRDIFYIGTNENRTFCSHSCCSSAQCNFSKRKIQWNKGLTKENNERIATAARKLSITKTMLKTKRVCIYCNKEFYDRVNINRKYCSKKCSAICNKNIQKTWSAMSPMRRKFLHKYAGMCALLAQRKKSTYVFMNIKFDSQEELAFAKVLFNNNIITQFLENKNCHIKVSVYEFDFKIENIFIEYHPWCKELTHKQYYTSRRRILNENGFEKNKLIVIKSKNEVGDFVDRLKQVV